MVGRDLEGKRLGLWIFGIERGCRFGSNTRQEGMVISRDMHPKPIPFISRPVVPTTISAHTMTLSQLHAASLGHVALVTGLEGYTGSFAAVYWGYMGRQSCEPLTMQSVKSY